MFLTKKWEIKQLQTSLEKEKKLVERMQEENYLKRAEMNAIDQKLIKMHQNMKKTLKEV